MWACLTTEGFNVIGESRGFRPVPVDNVDILIFEYSCQALREVLRLTTGRQTKLVASVQDPNEADLCRLIEAGVRAVLVRNDLSVERLSSTMRSVASGVTAAPADLMVRALSHARTSGVGARGLNDREREVLRWLAEGSDTLEIATGLCFSERTVKNVVHDILMKLNCRTRAHAVALATRSGVI